MPAREPGSQLPSTASTPAPRPYSPDLKETCSVVSTPLFIQERAFENSRLDQEFEFVGCTSFQVNPLKLKAPMNANNGKGGGSTYRRTHFWCLQSAAFPHGPAGKWLTVGPPAPPRRLRGTWSDVARVTRPAVLSGWPSHRRLVGAKAASRCRLPGASWSPAVPFFLPPRPPAPRRPGREAGRELVPTQGCGRLPAAGRSARCRAPGRVASASLPPGPWTHILCGKSHKYFYLS